MILSSRLRIELTSLEDGLYCNLHTCTVTLETLQVLVFYFGQPDDSNYQPLFQWARATGNMVIQQRIVWIVRIVRSKGEENKKKQVQKNEQENESRPGPSLPTSYLDLRLCSALDCTLPTEYSVLRQTPSPPKYSNAPRKSPHQINLH